MSTIDLTLSDNDDDMLDLTEDSVLRSLVQPRPSKRAKQLRREHLAPINADGDSLLVGSIS